jgi:hypothetical protein
MKEKRMKRTSILATMLAAALFGIAALGSGSASAAVLCENLAGNDCPAGETYGVGTEFHAERHGVMTLKSGAGETIFACAGSDLDMTVTDAGELGYGWAQSPEVDISNLTFGSCGDDPTSVVSDGSAVITQEEPGSGSQKGIFHWSGAQIETLTMNALNPKPYKCTYTIVGTGLLVGAKTIQYSNLTKLVFSSALAEKVSGSVFCPGKTYFSGQYDFDLDPEGIYVALQ